MKKVKKITIFLIFLFLLNACAKKQYQIKSFEGYLVEMNSSLDNKPDTKMLAHVNSYKNKLDVKMNKIIGEATVALTKAGTQSVLANFTTDAMKEYATGLWGTVDFAVINNGGLRTTLNKGQVTVSNIYEIYAFENCLVLLELSGKNVRQLFEGFAKNKIEGFSKGVKLTVKNKSIESLSIGDKPLDDNAIYQVVTVDYLAEGNDNMEALAKAVKYTESNIVLRDAIIDYIKKLTSENKKINAMPDDRIEIKD